MSNNVCRVCTTQIMQMCRKNTGLCGELCEKLEKKTQTVNLKTYEEESQKTLEIVKEAFPERPEVPSLLGWRVAAQLENVGRLMTGDIRRNPDQSQDYWDGSRWVRCEQIVANG